MAKMGLSSFTLAEFTAPFLAHSDVYHLPKVFQLNYEAVKKRLKVYIYPDGDTGTFYHTPRKLTGKYASEVYFFKNIRDSTFRTTDPKQGTSYGNMTFIIETYVESLIFKYPYWNKTLGADHFFVTCHDVGVLATEGLPMLAKNYIRVVCSSGYNDMFLTKTYLFLKYCFLSLIPLVGTT